MARSIKSDRETPIVPAMALIDYRPRDCSSARSARHDPRGREGVPGQPAGGLQEGTRVGLVRDTGADPFNGSLYVFRAKRADRIKIVWWDGTGLCLYVKRLEKAAFCWPRIGNSRVQLSHAPLLSLVEGMDWKRVRSVPVSRPQSAG